MKSKYHKSSYFPENTSPFSTYRQNDAVHVNPICLDRWGFSSDV